MGGSPVGHRRVMGKEANNDLSSYRTLVYRLLAAREESGTLGVAFALTSVHTREGVSFTTNNITRGNKETYEGHVQAIELLSLYAEGKPTDEAGEEPVEETVLPEPVISRSGKGLASDFRAPLLKLAAQSDLLLIDCPALTRSGETLAVTSLVSGVLLVVQAERTTRSEILSAERKIAAAGGNLFGFVLNRTKQTARLWPFGSRA